MNVQFTRTRKCIEAIKSRRSNSQQKRNHPTARSNVGRYSRPQSYRSSQQISKNNRRHQKVRSRSGNRNSEDYQDSPFPIVGSNHDDKFHTVRRKEFNASKRALQFSGESGIIHNWEDKNRVEIKPPQLTFGTDGHGAYVDMVGTEALFPLTVNTTASVGDAQPTTGGNIIQVLPIAPSFLTNTRLKLLSLNYERWKPMNIRINFQPMGNSTLSGGVILVPVCDPAVTLTSKGDGISIIQRAMDFEGAIAFNVYNYGEMEFPKLPEDEEPYYLQTGSDARFEVPYMFFAIAQTSYEPENALTPSNFTRQIGWMTIDYNVRFYDARLPDMGESNVTIDANLIGLTSSDVFWVTNIGDLVVFEPSTIESLPQAETLYIMYVETTPAHTGAFPVHDYWSSSQIGEEFQVRAGMVFFVKWGNYLSAQVRPAVFASLNDALAGQNHLVWAASADPGVYDTGDFSFVRYSDTL